jgi:chaperonin GroEL (HSP60 family)
MDKESLKKVAVTSMASKLVSGYSDILSDIAVDAVLQVVEEADGGNEVDLDMIKIEKKPGGSLTDTALIKGLIIDKEVVHADMPKKVKDAKIGLLNAALEIEKTEFDAKIQIETPDEMQVILTRRRTCFGRWFRRSRTRVLMFSSVRRGLMTWFSTF